MLRKISKWLLKANSINILFLGLLSISVLIYWLGLWTETISMVGLSFLGLISVLWILDMRFFWVLLWWCLPLTIQVDFSNSFAIDFPAEPILILLSVSLIYISLFTKAPYVKDAWQNQTFILLSLSFVWYVVCDIYQGIPLTSFKFLLAKSWYIIPGFIGFWAFAYRHSDQNRIMQGFLFFYAITLLVSFSKTILGQFSFEMANKFAKPFYENHVIYSSVLNISVCMLLYQIQLSKKGHLGRYVLWILTVISILGIYFSYTRASYLALFGSLASIFLIRYKLMSKFFLTIIMVLGIAVIFLFTQARYLRFATEYHKKVMHDNFKDHVSATFEGKDVSSMERLNMWIAVIRMSQDNLFFGVGSNQFVHRYKPYSAYEFQTWVSDNPLRITCHNYFLLQLAEHGLIGLILFIALIYRGFMRIETLYHRAVHQRNIKNIAIMLSGILTAIVILLMFNDLIEALKIGFIFFVVLAWTEVEIHKLNNQKK
ncbi:MAG: O-antigen ligase family protein [Chitinophagales bacterium]|jgi:O-antigen ligase|nr:O-antigen ligase family protein [Chitinophagales bacterium]